MEKTERTQTYSERIARETLLNNAKGTPEGRQRERGSSIGSLLLHAPAK